MATISRSMSPTRVGALLIAIVAVFGIGLFTVTSAAFVSPFPSPSFWTAHMDGAVTDGTGIEDHIFNGGGSKDIRDINQWGWRAGNDLPAKTDLTHIATWRDGDFIYFAAQRASGNGNAKIGFWFLKNGAGEGPNGTFVGNHSTGDILVEADFTTGSDNTRGLAAFKWEEIEPLRGRITGHFRAANGEWSDCSASGAGSLPLCGTVNGGSITSPFTNQTIEAGRLFQGRIDISYFDLEPLGSPCLPGVVAVTRASGTPVTAVLKDYVLGANPACSLTIRKYSPDATAGDTFSFTSGELSPSPFELTASTSGTYSNGNKKVWPTLSSGSYTVTESAKAGWVLTDITCTGGTYVANTDGGSVTVSFASIGNVVCTYTNRRSPTVEVIKRVNTDDSTAQFALRIDSTTYTQTATDGTTTGAQYVTPGAVHSVSETDGSGAVDLSAYTTNIACTNNGSNYTTGTNITGATRSLSLGTVNYGARIVCTITNSKVPKITIVKDALGPVTFFDFTTTGGAGLSNFRLTMDSNPDSSSVTFVLSSTTGTWTIEESAKTGWMLTDLECDPSTGSGTFAVTVSTGDRRATITDIGYRHVTCSFTNTGPLATRTQGFWSTHYTILQPIWGSPNDATTNQFGNVISWSTGDKTLCNVSDQTTDSNLPGSIGGYQSDMYVEDVLGGFWSKISFWDNGQKRSPEGQARMQLAQQLLAALLNRATFGAYPATSEAIATAKTAFCLSTNANTILASASALAAYNESGDSGVFTPGLSAKPQQARSLANYPYWSYIR